MSGSGGYHKYRCKYWATHECDKWIYRKDSACPWCIAAGRDDIGLPPKEALGRSQQVCVPIVHEGTITYTIMELVQTSQSASYWALRQKTTEEHLMPVTTTSDTPGIVLPTVGVGMYQVY